ncbi:MAG: hypothetical protein ACU836_17885 [Gammaproteobacteria bacterium]
MHKLIFGSLLLLTSIATDAMPPDARSLALDQISMEHINIQGYVQTWRLRKVCIDDQAYLLLLQGTTEVPISISVSFKDGMPEQCHVGSSNESGRK